jgi:CheY-like chemotaxis protein
MTSDPIAPALAALAHEVRTPLNGILALAELLAASDLPKRERGWAEALKSAGDHLARLTTLVVDGARAQAHGLVLARETFSPRALAAAIAASLSARAQANGLTAVVGIAEDSHQVVGDQVRLRSVLENLLDNAVKFTPRGRVGFTAAAAPSNGLGVRLVLTVEDEGIGLSARAIGRLFRPYAQASPEIGRRFGGAGLGLSLAREVARAMAGDLTVRSTAGKGSVFRLEIVVERVASAVPVAATGRRPLAGAHAAQPGAALTMVCAEDNPYGRVVLSTIASALGHTVEFVGSGDAAVAAVRDARPDLVLMDLLLPGIDGLEAARRIRALPGVSGTIPIIGVSGCDRAGNEAAARAAGMDDYLVKPVSAGALADAIDKAMRR